MCGLNGIFHFDGAPVDPVALTRMTQSIRHRGPDSQGIRLFSFRDPKSFELEAGHEPGTLPTGKFHAGVGFRRLSIQDLTANGHQPMCNADASIFIAFNGEVYNAHGFRPELEAAGFRFRGRSDTEVVLYLYEKYGIDGMLERLRGMFAICLVDLRARQMFLVRDQLGIKPLYWWTDQRSLLFASEIKAFLGQAAFKPALSRKNLEEFLLFRQVSGDETLFDSVKQLEPGTYLQISEGGIASRRYWHLPSKSRKRDIPFAQAVDEYEAKLSESVRLQLVSDVKLGCQLSGGIDSSLVTAIAASSAGGRLEAVSILFEDAGFSEKEWIDQVAQAYGVQTHTRVMDATYFLEKLESATWHLDQPLNHPNSIGIWGVAETARPHMTVLLSGEGADEVLGGYNRYFYAGLLSKVAGALPGASRSTRLKKRLIEATSFLTPGMLSRLNGDLNPERAISKRLETLDRYSGTLLQKMMRYEQATYLVDLLIRQDKMTMAHSVENRVPFLDPDLLEFADSLPLDYLVAPGFPVRSQLPRRTKPILKALSHRRFGERFTYRRKVGFDVPLRSFFGHPAFEARFRDSLLPGIRGRGVLDPKTVETLWNDREQGDVRALEALWICCAFEVWAQRFLDRMA